MFAISARNRSNKSRRGSEDLSLTIINEAVIFLPLLLMENLVQNLFFIVVHKSMDRGGRVLYHIRAVPLRHVPKNRHLATSECPQKDMRPSNKLMKSDGFVDPSNMSIDDIFKFLSILTFTMSADKGFPKGTSNPPGLHFMCSFIKENSSRNLAISELFWLLVSEAFESSSSLSSYGDFLL